MTRIEESMSSYVEGLFEGNEESRLECGLDSFVDGVSAVMGKMLDRGEIFPKEADILSDALILYKEVKIGDEQKIGEEQAIAVEPSFADLNQFLKKRLEKTLEIVNKVAGVAAAVAKG